MISKTEYLDQLDEIATKLRLNEMEAAIYVVKHPSLYNRDLVDFCKEYTEGDLYYGF